MFSYYLIFQTMKIFALLLMSVLLVACGGETAQEKEVEQKNAQKESMQVEKGDREESQDKRSKSEEEKEKAVEQEPTVDDAAVKDAEDSEETEAYVYDSGKLSWNAGKIVAGGDHGGVIDIKSATAQMSGESLVSAEFVIDMATMVSDSAGLDKHLKNEDFFDVEKYPTATLNLTSATATDEPDVYTLSGTLEIMGKTNPISFPAMVKDVDGKVSANAEFTIDRTVWGITYGSGSFFKDIGDKAIRDDIEFAVDVVLAAKQ